MEQLEISPPPRGSFGALLRACRHWALLSQEQLAARAEVSERTVRDLEAGRVRSPRPDIVRLLSGALQLAGPQRASWLAAARDVVPQPTRPAAPRTGGPAHPPGDAPARPLSAGGSGMTAKLRCRPLPAREFPAKIVALCWHEDRPASQAAQDIDLTETAARAPADRAGPDAKTRGNGGLTRADRRELAQLRRETAGSAKTSRS